ncbi:MAG: RNA methyltransferase [Rhodospirillales bacterium]|nr:RNA methyltransferase [Rhodospirillales bacterium]
MTKVRGYFGVGVEGINKTMNVGSIFRSAHAFGAGFVFTVAATYKQQLGKRADTSNAAEQLPFYSFPNRESMVLPQGCQLVGVELTDDAVDLPSFRHPTSAAYILGPERGSLSPEMVERCNMVVKIPTKFCVNVGIAAAVVMYDRVQSLGRFADRPVMPGQRPIPLEDHVQGSPIFRTKIKGFRDTPPLEEDEYGFDGGDRK